MRFSGPILQTQEVERFGKNTLIYSGYKPSACEDSYTTSSHAFLFLNYTIFPLRVSEGTPMISWSQQKQ